MAKLHEIKAKVQEVTGLSAFDENSAVRVQVTGDQPQLVPVVADKLRSAGINFQQSKPRTFKGAFFTIPLRNVGSAFAANWEFA